MIPVTLDTAAWRPLPPPGVTPYQAYFNPADGTYCALGLLFKALGMSDTVLANCGFLEDLKKFGEEAPEGLTSFIAERIVTLSDEGCGILNGTAERAVTRAQITTLLGNAGYKAVWV